MIARSIKFDEKRWEALTEIAKNRGLSQAALIRDVVYAFLNSQKKLTK